MKKLIDKLSEQQSKQLLLKLCEFGWSDSIPDDIVEYCETEYKIYEDQKEETKDIIKIPNISDLIINEHIIDKDSILPHNEIVNNNGIKFKIDNIAEDFTADNNLFNIIESNVKDDERAYLLSMLDCCEKTITTGYLHYIDQKVCNFDDKFYIQYIVKPCRNDNGELIKATDNILEKSRDDFDKLFNYLSDL